MFLNEELTETCSPSRMELIRDNAFPCGRSWVRARKRLVFLRAAAHKDSAFPTYLADTQFYIQLSMLLYL